MPIEHWDLVAIYNWDYFIARAIAYLMRWQDKAGIVDLQKSIHFIEKRIELEKIRASGGDIQERLIREALESILRAEEDEFEKNDEKKLGDNPHGHPMRGITERPDILAQNRADIYAGKRGGPEGENYKAMQVPTGEPHDRT